LKLEGFNFVVQVTLAQGNSVANANNPDSLLVYDVKKNEQVAAMTNDSCKIESTRH
jgi:hypothetical protein